MTFCTIPFAESGVSVQISRYDSAQGVTEWHLMFHPSPCTDSFQSQYGRLVAAREGVMSMPEFCSARCMQSRWFVSDIANQRPLMTPFPDGASSVIQQPPLDGSKVALWMYVCRAEGDAVCDEHTFLLHRNGYTHFWASALTSAGGDSGSQTAEILERYETMLADRGMTLAGDCVRTWFFVRDVDTHYQGLVRARRENFEAQGLTPRTHFIASTGIGGCPFRTTSIVQMDAYAVKGLEEGQVQYLQALTHLNPTYEYGVTFERGTKVSYGDREHLFISGTASIDRHGEVVHVGDIVAQTHRMWENVEALLQEGGATFTDVMQMIVYLRDVADYAVVSGMFRQRFPNVPCIITLAPVCRPAWLIEMECVAVKESHHPSFRNF